MMGQRKLPQDVIYYFVFSMDQLLIDEIFTLASCS